MPEYEILVRLSEAPDRSIRMAELADAVVALAQPRHAHDRRLERDGIVDARLQCAADGRGVTPVLTDDGFERLRDRRPHARRRRAPISPRQCNR